MWLLTVMMFSMSGSMNPDSMQAFTKELPTEEICHKVGKWYVVTERIRFKAYYQCIRLDK